MPPMSKRQRAHNINLQKQERVRGSVIPPEGETSIAAQRSSHLEQDLRANPEELADLAMLSEDTLDTEDESVDPTFDMDASTKSNSNHLMDMFCEECVTHLD